MPLKGSSFDNAFALDAIANLLDGSMWTPEHLDQIADLVRQTGRAIGSPDEPRVRQPLPAELSPELRAALRMVDAEYAAECRFGCAPPTCPHREYPDALSPDEIEDLVCRRDWIEDDLHDDLVLDAEFEDITPDEENER